MTTATRPRTRIALRLLSAAFLVTALLASGGTASAAKKKAQSKAPAASQDETPPPAAAAPAEETPAAAEPAPAPAAVPAAAPAEEPMAPAPVAAPAPAAAPASAATPAEAGAASPLRKHRGQTVELGLSPQTTSYSADNVGPPAATEAPAAEDWGFKFHGFFRGPMRLSMDTEAGRGVQFHAPPVTPDLNYTTWSYTNNNPGPWAEMILQYGNNRAIMTAAIASYNITSGGWRELQDQLGIDRAFLTLNFPDAFGDVGKMTWNVGVFSDRYGAMGKYDGGAYDTYMMGRTRIAGATGTFDFDILDDFRIVEELGAGAKMDVQQWQIWPYTSWQPYPGYEQMGTTLLVHEHAGLVIANMLTITSHVLYTWTKDAMRTDMNDQAAFPQHFPSANYVSPPGLTDPKKAARDGSMLILGEDFRLDGGWLGTGYLGVSAIKTTNVGVLADSVEVMHSQGGWQYAANYTGKTGDGWVTSIGAQYTFSLAAVLARPQAWWGQGWDFTLQLFGMLNHISGVDSLDETYVSAQGKTKLKTGAQWLYTPLPFMSVGERTDWVQPNMSDNTHSFWVWSPRLIFRTEFVTHEQVTIQYQYYSYGSWYTSNPVGSLPYPYGQAGNLWVPLQPDRHTFTIAASMWW